MAKFAKIIHQNNENLLIQKFITLFKAKIRNNRKSRFSFVLTGGNSPKNLYTTLSKTKNINWKKIDFFISDERYVNENSRNSNIGMCNKYLFKKIKITTNQINKISTNIKPLSKCASDYEIKIRKYFLNKKISFDLVLLGIGTDGHIASLFKNNIKNKTNNNVVVVNKKDFLRISLTLKCLNNSKTIFLWAPGKNKSNIIKKIKLDKRFDYPVSFLKKKNNFLFYCY
tara:strand:- start:4748 stop:5428 length:681 start_codon:yes stop_codon:yes gene_type:complete